MNNSGGSVWKWEGKVMDGGGMSEELMCEVKGKV